eukprot:13958420-Heterocapsa_arctica.AAC.1
MLPCPARPGPGGGHQGGVAILLPHPIEVISSRILVPGCAVECIVRLPKTTADIAIWSVYLPPEDREAVLTSLEAHAPPQGMDTFLAGDFN